MSNTCFSMYTVKGSPKDIRRLDAVLTSISKRTEKAAGSVKGQCWFEHVLEYLGLEKETGRFDTRGHISCISRGHGKITFHTESAWAPNHDIVTTLTSAVSENFKILYEAQEYNMGIFITNNPAVSGKWVYIYGRDIDDYPEPLRPLLESDELLESSALGDALAKSLGHDGNLRHLAAEACRRWGLDLYQYEEEPIC